MHVLNFNQLKSDRVCVKAFIKCNKFRILTVLTDLRTVKTVNILKEKKNTYALLKRKR